MLGLLPAALFPSGHLYYTQGVQDWPENKDPGVFAVHTTFVSGMLEKSFFMRERGLWKASPPDYMTLPLLRKVSRKPSGYDSAP